MTNGESGLSDIALQWMIDQLGSVGVRFATVQGCPITPNVAGTAHKPWAHLPWNLPGVPLGARSFPQGMLQDPSIAARMVVGNVLAEPGEPPGLYQPHNLL